MSDSVSPPLDQNKQNYKLGRVLEEYNLRRLDAELGKMWLGKESDETYSLRELSDYVNKQLLRTAMERAGINLIDGETEETYRILTNDNINDTIRMNTVQRLEREGIEVRQLESDFVSHQSVYTYLTEFRDVKQNSPHQKTASSTQDLRERFKSDTADLLESYQEDGRVSLGEFELDIDIRVRCEDCKKTYTLEELLGEGQCDCN